MFSQKIVNSIRVYQDRINVLNKSNYAQNYRVKDNDIKIRLQQTVQQLLLTSHLRTSRQMMKESHLYQRNEQTMTRRLSETGQKSSALSSSKHQLIDPLFKLMEFIVHSEERIQIYKEMLTQRNDFSPQPLFNWISKHQSHIDKRHIVSLFDQNIIPLQQDYIKLYFHSYSYKDKIDFSAFINMIFPQNTDLIKYISVTGIKKYSHNSELSEEVLVDQELRFLEGLDTMKNELIPKITRKEIKNLMRIIKKNGESNSLMEIDSRPFVKYEELKAMLKNYVTKTGKGTNVLKTPKAATTNNSAKKSAKKQQALKENSTQNIGLYQYLQRNCLSIFRKLSMGKTSFISLQDFQFWLRPWNKQRGSLNVGEECASNIFTISGINQIDQSKISFEDHNQNLPLSHRAR